MAETGLAERHSEGIQAAGKQILIRLSTIDNAGLSLCQAEDWFAPGNQITGQIR